MGTIISFIKDLKPKEAHNKDLLRVWTCIITGISSVIEAERRSYLLKPSSFKEKSLQKLGNDYRWILSNVPEQVIRTVWPKVIVPQICSTLNQPEDGCMCRPLSLSGAQILRRILSVRYYKHHLSEKLWKELLNVCLGLIISKDSGKLLKTTICEILAMLVGSNRSLRDSYYGIISVIFNFLKDSRNESHCTTILASVLNYTLIETSPEILCEYGACALLSDNLPAIISNFSSARVGTRLLCHLTNMLRHLASADIFSLDEKQHYSKPMHPSNSPGSSLLLDLHEIILDKVDLSFPDNVEEFIKLISGSGDIEKHSLLLGSRSKTGYNNTACFRYSDRSDIYTMLLELHTKILLKIIENDQPEKVISHSPPTKGVKCGTYVIDRIIELALSDGKLNQNRKLWCIKVLCVLITFIDGCTPSIILDIWDKVCSMCERCATAVSEKKKIQWLMVLIGSILHSESIKRRIEIDAVCSPSFAARVRQLSELALQGISQDEMRGPSFFVIEGVIRLVISRNLRSIIIWLEQELLQIMKQEMTVLILAEFRSYALLFSMANSGCSDSNLGIMLDRFMGCAINDVLKLPDSRNTHSASALTVQNASIVIHLLCDNPEFHKSANYDLHCLQMITSPFAVLPEEQLLVEYRLSFLSCVFHNLRSGSPLSILTKSCFNNIPNPSDLPFYTTRCYHTHINVEVTNYIARRFYNYLYKNSREGCSSHDSSIPIDKQLILRSTLLLLLSLDWITLLKFCGPQCRLNSTGPHLNNLLQLIVENLASDLDSCASEIIASHDIISNVYEILYRIGELFPKIGSTCGDYGIITELESKASILIYKKSIFRIYNKLLEVLHYILEKLSTVDQSGTLGGNLDVDRSDYDTREAPKYIDHPCIHLDVLYGYDALKESDSSKITLTGDHSCCSTIDCLRILSNLIRFITNRKGVSNISDDVDIPSAVTDLLPTLYSKSIRSAFCLLNWLSDVSSDITQDRMYIVTNVCSEMLSEYRYEEDFVVWIFVIRCLTAIVPSMTGLNLKSRILNNVSQILLFFSRRLYNNSASWRVLYELENFIKTCMKTRVVHILLNCITQHQQDTGWINNTLSFLVKHANFLVMASACEICVMKICCDGTDSETRNTIYSDISAITLDNKLLFTVSAMALGFCMVKSDEYRMEALVCLLQNIGNYDSIVMQVISDAAKYLKYGSVQNFLRKEMFPIICCWKQYSMEQFPYRYAGYDSLVDMYKDMGHYMAFFVLQKSNFEESVLFPNVKLDKMSLDKILVDTLPLVLVTAFYSYSS